MRSLRRPLRGLSILTLTLGLFLTTGCSGQAPLGGGIPSAPAASFQGLTSGSTSALGSVFGSGGASSVPGASALGGAGRSAEEGLGMITGIGF